MPCSTTTSLLIPAVVALAMCVGCEPKTEEVKKTVDTATAEETPPKPADEIDSAAENATAAANSDDAASAAAAVTGEATTNPAEDSSSSASSGAASETSSDALTQSQAANEAPRRRRNRGGGGNRGIDEVRATGIEETALNVGDKAIDGQLVDAEGQTIRLSELWQEQPLVLVWYRGGWCPFCNRHLSAIQSALPEISAAGGLVAAITPELPDRAAATMSNNELDYIVLSDRSNKLAHEYGVAFKLPDFVATRYQDRFDLHAYNGDDSDELPLAATYVIDALGNIRYAFIDADYTRRADPAEIIATLNEL